MIICLLLFFRRFVTNFSMNNRNNGNNGDIVNSVNICGYAIDIVEIYKVMFLLTT